MCDLPSESKNTKVPTEFTEAQPSEIVLQEEHKLQSDVEEADSR